MASEGASDSTSKGAARLNVISQQVLGMSACEGAVKSLPRFDAHVLEAYIDDQRELKQKVYDIFKANPDLLVSEEEGLSKGERRAPRVSPQVMHLCTSLHGSGDHPTPSPQQCIGGLLCEDVIRHVLVHECMHMRLRGMGCVVLRHACI